MTGIERIEGVFYTGKALSLMIHAVCGYPTMETSRRALLAAARSGADLLEAQLPFSEPSADGPLIVRANHEALRSGASTAASIEMLASLRGETAAPVLVMSYVNPILAYGLDRLVSDMAAAGLDGLIVPDYPDDEPELDLGARCAAAGLALVPLIAPTTPLDRAVLLAAGSASPLLYAILRLGVTGRRTELGPEAADALRALRERTGKRVAAGFGIGDRRQLEELRGRADCAVVGSALLSRLIEAVEAGRDPAEAAGAFVASLVTGPSAA